MELLLKRIDRDSIDFGTTVEELHTKHGRVEVSLSNGRTGAYNAAVIADGIHSHTRSLVLYKSQYHFKSTGWGGWVTWRDESDRHDYQEYWGAGTFVGLYPVKDKTGVFVGGSLRNIGRRDSRAFLDDLSWQFTGEGERPAQALEAMRADDEPFFREFEDVRSDIWHKENVVLLGDAATGFLPTAGVGASMAMDSAAALADELSRADADHLSYALKLYANRQKSRVEKAQSDSRKMGRLMFVESGPLARLRDKLVPFYSLERMVSDLVKVMEGA